MMIFVDSAQYEQCAHWLSQSLVQGVTTNSSILRKADEHCLTDLAKRILAHNPRELRLQVISEASDEAFHQAETLAGLDDRIRVKVPFMTSQGHFRTSLISRCVDAGIRTNVTACTTMAQGFAAVALGVSHVSLLWCRMKDADVDPAEAVGQVARHRDRTGLPAAIVIGSIRDPRDVTDAVNAGADIVTVAPQILAVWLHSNGSVEMAQQFREDAREISL